MHIRELTEEDAEAFRTLRLRGFREDPESFGSSYDEESAKPVEAFRAVLSRRQGCSDDFVLGAFAPEGHLVGIVGLRREPRRKRSHRATLWGMYVVPEARGGGVARALLGALLERARRLQGLEQVLLSVMAHNTRAIALYRALGFEQYGYEPAAMKLDGKAYDECAMLVRLNPAPPPA